MLTPNIKDACDCHVHVIGPKRDFPLASPRTYTPPDAAVEACAAMLERLGTARVVVVQPSIYGDDHHCLLHALAVLGRRARGVAVMPERATATDLAAWHAAGVRGLRINAATATPPPAAAVLGELDRLAAAARDYGWHIQLFARMPLIETLAADLGRLPVPVVLDHCCLASCPAAGVPPEWPVLARLMEGGKVWIKLSGAYRLADDPGSLRVARLFRYLLAANPGRLVWGSDWPHTPHHGAGFVGGEEETPYQRIDTPSLLDSVCRWAGSPRLLHRLLVDNPARLYGFC